MNAAMSNDTKMIKFPRGCKDELCSLDGQSDGTKLANFDWVPMETIDHFVKQYEVPKIDVLKVGGWCWSLLCVLQGFAAMMTSGS